MSSTQAAAGFTLRPLAPSFGAEILGLDLGAPIDDTVAERLLDAYRRHRLLLVRGQPVSAADQARFGRVFGDIQIREHNLANPMTEAEQHVSNVRADGVFGRGDLTPHMDQLFYQEPLSALILCAIEVPKTGGETYFTDTAEVLAAMPEALRQRIADVTCRTTRAYDDATARRYNVSNASATIVSSTHKMIWTDPETGRPALWCGWAHLTRVLGMDQAASDALVNQVMGCVDASPAIYCHKWQPDDLILWNNRTLFHARTPFDESQPRTLRRTPLVQRVPARAA